MTEPTINEIIDRLSSNADFRRYEENLRTQLEKTLEALVYAPVDKVPVLQGRAQQLRDLLKHNKT
jgi:hypothetical protein